MEEATGLPACLFGIYVVAVVGLFSSLLVFPSLLEEGAAKPQGKGPLLLGSLSPLGALEEGEGDQIGGRGPQWFLPLEKSQVVSLTSRDFEKAENKIPNKTPV